MPKTSPEVAAIGRALWRAARAPNRAAAMDLWQNWRTGRVSLDELRASMWLCWTWGKSALPDESWIELFAACGFLSDWRDDPPSGDLVLYRGSRKQGRVGMSWTERSFVARDYAMDRATHGNGYASVWVTRMPAAGVLAMWRRGRHSEVVVDPTKIGRIDQYEPVSVHRGYRYLKGFVAAIEGGLYSSTRGTTEGQT